MDSRNPNGPAAAAQVPVSKSQAENATKPSALDNSSKAKPLPMCRYFSRGFCRNGDVCRFRHAAPNAVKCTVASSCRYENRVCRFYQQGRCRYGDSCRFRHIKPQAEAQEEEEEDEEYISALMACLAIGFRRHIETQSDEEETEEEEEEEEGLDEDIDLLLQRLGYYGEMSEDEMEERVRNWGFTEDEVNELLCQGVKPYDSDAENVLAALQGDWYEHCFGYDSMDDEDFDDDDNEDLNLDKLDLDTSSSGSDADED